MGIVFDAKPTGGIKICCDHGIITHSGGPGVYWVPVKMYVVRAKPDEFIPIPDELYTVNLSLMEILQKRVFRLFPMQSYMKLCSVQLVQSRRHQDASAKRVSAPGIVVAQERE
jgi:hypothetical protein